MSEAQNAREMFHVVFFTSLRTSFVREAQNARKCFHVGVVVCCVRGTTCSRNSCGKFHSFGEAVL